MFPIECCVLYTHTNKRMNWQIKRCWEWIDNFRRQSNETITVQQLDDTKWDLLIFSARALHSCCENTRKNMMNISRLGRVKWNEKRWYLSIFDFFSSIYHLKFVMYFSSTLFLLHSPHRSALIVFHWIILERSVRVPCAYAYPK